MFLMSKSDFGYTNEFLFFIPTILCILKEKSIGVLKITNRHHPPCIRKAISGTFLSRSTLAPVEIVSLYLKISLFLKAEWRNQPQSFSTWKVWSGTSHWIHLGFPISIPGVRNILQSQEVFLMDANLTFSIFKIKRTAIHQIVCILKDKSIGVLKISYGHHPWGQERPPCIMKALWRSRRLQIILHQEHFWSNNLFSHI